MAMNSITAYRGPPSFTRQSPRRLFKTDLSSPRKCLSDQEKLKFSTFSVTAQNEASKPTVKESVRKIRNTLAKSDNSEIINEKQKIEFDPALNDKRCTHTTIQPSTMMTLAMELQISNRGKASKIFREGRLKARSSEDKTAERETILTKLWVIPPTDSASRGNTPSTAIHLQPSLTNTDFVFRRTPTPVSKCTSPPRSERSSATDLQSDDLVLLANITGADLVGSADDVELYSELNGDEVEINNKLTTVTAKSRKDKKWSAGDSNSSTSSENKAACGFDNDARRARINNVRGMNEMFSLNKKNLNLNKKANFERIRSYENACSVNDSFAATNLPELSLVKTSTTAPLSSVMSNKVIEPLKEIRNYDDMMSSRALADSFNGDCMSMIRSAMSGRTKNGCESINTKIEKRQPNLSNERALNDINDCKVAGSACIAEATLLSEKVQSTTNKITKDLNKLAKCPEETGSPRIIQFVEKNYQHPLSSFHTRQGTSGAPSSLSKSSSLVSITSFESVSSQSVSSSLSSSEAMLSPPSSRLTSNEHNHNLANGYCLGTYTSCECNKYNKEHTTFACANQTQAAAHMTHTEGKAQASFSINNTHTHAIAEHKTRPPLGRTDIISRNRSRSDRNATDKTVECCGEIWPSGQFEPASQFHPAGKKFQSSRNIVCKTFSSKDLSTNRPTNNRSATGLVISQAVFPEEKISTAANPKLDLKNRNDCSSCQNTMALCCCPRKRSGNWDDGRRSKSNHGFYQMGSDPIVRSLRTSGGAKPNDFLKEKLFGSETPDNSHFKVRANSSKSTLSLTSDDREKASIVNRSNNQLAADVTNGENTNNSPINNQSNDKTTGNQSIEQHKVVVSCSTSDPSASVIPQDDITVTKVSEENTTFFEFQRPAKEIRNINTNPKVDVLNGSKISLKKPQDTSTSKWSTSAIDNTSDSCTMADKQVENQEVVITEHFSASSAARLQATVPAEKCQLSDHKKINKVKSDSVVAENRNEKVRKMSAESKNTLYSGTFNKEALRSNALTSMSRIQLVPKNSLTQNQNRHDSKSPAESSVANKNTQKYQVVVKTSATDSPSNSKFHEVAPRKEMKIDQKAQNSFRKKYEEAPCVVESAGALEMSSKHSRVDSPKPVYSSTMFLQIRPSGKKMNYNVASPSPNAGKLSVTEESLSNRVLQANKNTSHRQYTKPAVTQHHSLGAVTTSLDQVTLQVNNNNSRGNTSRQQSARCIMAARSTSPPLKATSPDGKMFKYSERKENGNEIYVDSGLRTSGNSKESKGMSLIGNGTVVRPMADTPAHSNVDEEDFSGVVEAPMLKVKEIRARYKVRDYEDYAKPKAPTASRHNIEECQINKKTFSTVSDGLNEDTPGKREVSQQVMSLFKGALDFKEEPAVFEQEKTLTHRAQPSPVKHNGHFTTAMKSLDQQDVAKETPVQVRNTPGKLKTASWLPAAPVEENSKKNIKESVRQIKSETEAVTSFDESLDQFYNVLNDLSLS